MKRRYRRLGRGLCVAAVLALAGCETPQRASVLRRMDQLQSENSALKAGSETQAAQARVDRTRQQEEDLKTIEALNRRCDDLTRRVEELAKVRPAEPAPAPAPAPAPGPSEAELKARFEKEQKELQARKERDMEELAKAQVQAEAARIAAQNPTTTSKPGEWKGQKLPLAKFVDSAGKVVDLAQYQGQKTIVLVVMKGFYSQGICLFCTRQTSDLKGQAQAFRDAGAEVFVVYPGAEEHINAFVNSIQEYEKSTDPRFQLPFKVLLDVNQDAVRAFRISGDLAHPTSFVLDRDGVVCYQKVGRTMSDRPKAAELLEVVKALGSAKP